jgi:hypothetical protein
MAAVAKNGTPAEAQDSPESSLDRSELGRQKDPSSFDIPIPLVAARREAQSKRTKYKSNTILPPVTARTQIFATRWSLPLPFILLHVRSLGLPLERFCSPQSVLVSRKSRTKTQSVL